MDKTLNRRRIITLILTATLTLTVPLQWSLIRGSAIEIRKLWPFRSIPQIRPLRILSRAVHSIYRHDHRPKQLVHVLCSSHLVAYVQNLGYFMT